MSARPRDRPRVAREGRPRAGRPSGHRAGAPYTVEIDWLVGARRFRVHDATGASMLDTPYPARGAAGTFAPWISYSRYPGTAISRPAFTTATTHPPVIVQSLRYVGAR